MKLDQAILSHFHFTRDPFINDVDDDKDVYTYAGYSKLERAIRAAIDECGMIALAGPVGSGKTTLMDGIEADYASRGDVIVCKPYIKDKEKLTDGHLTRALLYSLTGENCRIPGNAEDQGRLLSRSLVALRHGSEGGKRAILYIDDAHHCTASVLRTLKAFYEEKVGRHRLLAIILVGTEELKAKLSRSPELGHRARLLEIPPVQVRDYLEFKLKRVCEQSTDVSRLISSCSFRAYICHDCVMIFAAMIDAMKDELQARIPRPEDPAKEQMVRMLSGFRKNRHELNEVKGQTHAELERS